MALLIGDVRLGSIPRVVGVVSDRDIHSLSDDTVERIDILELRVDMFAEFSSAYVGSLMSSVKSRFGKPVIVTIRSKEEGGHADIDDGIRMELFAAALPLADAADIEIHSAGGLPEKVVALCKKLKKTSIVSYHNFEETPDKNALGDILAKAKRTGADIVKIAAKAQSKDDVARLAAFTFENKADMLVTISLGNIGLMSRIFNHVVGSLLTYGHLGSPSSPGQISAVDLVERLRMFDPLYNEDLINRIHLMEYV